jgi:protein-S-isoprenylcysteine O-methyltransferase Ste14
MLWPILLLPVLLFVVQSYVIAREERYLGRKFGDEYLQYKSRVRRWL